MTPRNASNRISFKTLGELLGEKNAGNYETVKMPGRKVSPRYGTPPSNIGDEVGSDSEVVVKKAAQIPQASETK